jgi:hypothetical protein
MKRFAAIVLAGSLVTAVVGCATTAGALVGGGIGSMSGNTAAGASIGAGVGMIVDIAN